MGAIAIAIVGVLVFASIVHLALTCTVLAACSRPDYFFPRPLPMGNVNPFGPEYFSTIITSNRD